MVAVRHVEKNQHSVSASLSVCCGRCGYANAEILEETPAMPHVFAKPMMAVLPGQGGAYHRGTGLNEANSAFLRTKLLNANCTLGIIHLIFVVTTVASVRLSYDLLQEGWANNIAREINIVVRTAEGETFWDHGRQSAYVSPSTAHDVDRFSLFHLSCVTNGAMGSSQLSRVLARSCLYSIREVNVDLSRWMMPFA